MTDIAIRLDAGCDCGYGVYHDLLAFPLHDEAADLNNYQQEPMIPSSLPVRAMHLGEKFVVLSASYAANGPIVSLPPTAVLCARHDHTSKSP